MKYHTKPQRTQRDAELFYGAFSVTFVPLCEAINEISHKAAENTKGRRAFLRSFLCDLCAFVRGHENTEIKNARYS